MIGRLLDWLRRRHRPAPIPDALWRQTVACFPFLAKLSGDEQAKLRQLTERFLAEKEFATAGGLELTDAMCVTIAAQGCLLVLNLGLDAYRGWVGIVVYPDEFVIPRTIEDEFGVVHQYDEEASGEAWLGGPLIISWRDAQMAGDDYNVVIHEFAHKLDMLDGEADGIPALHSDLTREAWDEVLLAAYDDFCRRVDSGEDTCIDPYASENPSEFFAVLSESFFGMPDVIAGEYPELYDLLRRYYRQDPLARSTKAAMADRTAPS